MGDDVEDALILSLDNRSESWVVDLGASFHATSNIEVIENVRGDFEKVYLGDDKPCNIIGKGNVTVKLPNGATWKLNDVRLVPCLKMNLISVSQLASEGCTTTFSNDAWKVTK